MNDVKHTPGSEWKLEIVKPSKKFCGIARVFVGGELAYSAAYGDGHERAVADAHLIFAAPDLLAACEGMLADLEACKANPHGHDPLHHVAEGIAAIAKAAGSSLSPLTGEQK